MTLGQFEPIPVAELQNALPNIDLSGWDDCPPLFRSPRPNGDGVWFDSAAVVRVLRAMHGLPHNKGRWAGVPFVPDPWQIVWIVAPIFGWKREDGSRVFREAFVEIPRKAGKSTLASRLAVVLLCADGEMGAEVYAAAGSRDQARIVGNDMANVVRGNKRLASAAKPLTDRIVVESTGSVFRVLSKVAEVAHGLNVHGAVIDEVHVHKNRDLVDAIETGTGARSQPLIITITTADDGEEGTVYDEKHSTAVALSDGSAVLPSVWSVVWSADENADPLDEATWWAAQPGLGRSVSIETYREKAEKARQTPSFMPTFKRLYLNVRTREVRRFLDMDQWRVCGQMISPGEFNGLPCWLGLDLSATTDMTAAVFLGRDDDRDRWLVEPLFWLPEDRVSDIQHRTGVPLDEWVRSGFLRLTDGNVVDYRQVRADITSTRDKLGVEMIEACYDPWNATETIGELQDDGWVMVPIRQGFASMSPPMKELERLVLGSTVDRPLLVHGGHPVLSWHASCLEAKSDGADNLKPHKPDRRKATKRIDGMSALLTALARGIHGAEVVRSAYEDNDLMVV